MAHENQRGLVIIPGDGIGPEIIEQAGRVVEWFDTNRSMGLDITHRQLGVSVYRRHGTLLRDETLAGIKAADAALFGAIGGDVAGSVSTAAMGDAVLAELDRLGG